MTSAEKRQRIVEVARRWLGTPFHHHGQVRGRKGGVDCGHFVRLVYNEALGLELPEPPAYSEQWNLHRSEELYLDYLRQYARETDAPKLGDVVVFQYGRTFSHGAIATDEFPGRVIHAMQGSGVIYSDMRRDGQLVGRKYHTFSILEGN